MAGAQQHPVFTNEEAPSLQKVVDVIVGVLRSHEQPSAWNLVNIIENVLGWKARWSLKAGMDELMSAPSSKRAWRCYLESLTKSGDLEAALKGVDAPKKDIASSIDSLLRHSNVYRYSEQSERLLQRAIDFQRH